MGMRILVLGAGGTGGYFGGRLAETQADVTFLVRPQRAARLRQGGLIIKSPEGDAQIPAKIITADQVEHPYDLILFSCKAYDLDSAIAAIKPAVGPDTLILPFLNGLLHLDRLDDAFGKEKVLGGTCRISASMGKDGEIQHLHPFLHILTFGPRLPGQQAACRKIATLFDKAKFVSKLDDDIMQDMWDKFIFLTTLAAMTCLMRGSVGDIIATRDGQEILRETDQECRAIAVHSGYPPRASAAVFIDKVLQSPGSSLVASMLRDLEAGSAIEADHIVGDMLRRGEAFDLSSPVLRVAYCHLQVYEGQRKNA